MAVLDSIDAAIKWLEQARSELLAGEQSQVASSITDQPQPASSSKIAWGSHVSPEFRKRVQWIADQLGTDVNYLMACMAWESGRTFSPSIMNAAGSGAVGLIQFMPITAKRFGTTPNSLKAMTAEDQLRYVWEYFKPWQGRLRNLGDVYMTILWPKAVGHDDGFVLFNRSVTPTAFRQNAGLDINHDGLVTRGECLVKIRGMLNEGLLPQNIG